MLKWLEHACREGGEKERRDGGRERGGKEGERREGRGDVIERAKPGTINFTSLFQQP